MAGVGPKRAPKPPHGMKYSYDTYPDGKKIPLAKEHEWREYATAPYWDRNMDLRNTVWLNTYRGSNPEIRAINQDRIQNSVEAYKRASGPAGTTIGRHPEPSYKPDPDVEVYDIGDDTFADRYTVKIGSSIYGMSANATAPNGVNQYVGEAEDLPRWRQGNEILVQDAPPGVQRAIHQRQGSDEGSYMSSSASRRSSNGPGMGWHGEPGRHAEAARLGHRRRR